MEATNNIKNYEDYVGKEVIGFKFDSSNTCEYVPEMEDYIGDVGTIISWGSDYYIFGVDFGDDFWYYPADLVIKQLNQKEELVEMMEKDEESGIYEDDSEQDMVNSPSHYNKAGIECIDAIKSSMSDEAYRGYLKGSISKYIWRYEDKANPLEDLKKSRWFLDRLIKELENDR